MSRRRRHQGTPFDTRYMTTALYPVSGNGKAHGTNDAQEQYRSEGEPEFSDEVDYALNGDVDSDPSPSDQIPLTAESGNGQDEEDFEMSQRDVVDNMLGSENPRRDARSETGGKDSGEEDAEESSQMRRRRRGVNEDDTDDTHNPGSGSEVEGVVLGEVPRVIGYREHVISGTYGSLVIGEAQVSLPGRGVATVTRSAFLSKDDYDPMDTIELNGPIIGGLFDAIAAPFKAVAHAATHNPITHALTHNPLASAAENLAKDAIALSPINLVSHIIKGERIDHAVLNSAKNALAATKDVAPYVQTVVSTLPGVGTGVAAAIAFSTAIAEGQKVTDSFLAAARGAVPGGALGQSAFDIGARLAKGDRLDKAVLTAARNQVPANLRPAFDVGLALAHGQKLQNAIKSQALPAVASLAHQALVSNVANAAKALVKNAAGTAMAGLTVHVPGATPHALAAFGSATEALRKIADARAAVNAGELVKSKIVGRTPTLEEASTLAKARAGAIVHNAALDNIKQLTAAAQKGDPKSMAKVAILKIAKNAMADGAGMHGHFVSDKGQILKGVFAPA